MIGENEYDSDGSLDDKSTFTHDNKGNVIEENEYDSDGILASRWIYTYDNKGNDIEWNRYSSDGSLEEKRTYTYEFDQRGNWIKRIDFRQEEEGGELTLEYIEEREIVHYD